MASIYYPKIRVVSVKKISTPEFDKGNQGYAKYRVTAQVTFELYSDAPQAKAIEELTLEAKDKLEHALS